MLTRIYGTAFLTKEALSEYLERLELARARDHRRFGRELGLFHFSELAPGSAFWAPHGTTLAPGATASVDPSRQPSPPLPPLPLNCA